MRIAIATPVYYPMINGVARFSYNLATGLARRGHEVLVLTPSQNKKRHTEIMDGVRVVYLHSSTIKVYPDQIHDIEPAKVLFGKKLPKVFYKHGLKTSLFPAEQIKRVLDSFRPDVVHVQGSDPLGIAAVSYAKKHQIPLVMTEHNQPEVLTESLPIPRLFRGPVNNALSSYFVNRQSKADYATMPTELSISNLKKKHKIDVLVEAVSNGVDLTLFKPGEVNEHLYNKYGINRDALILLYVGRVDPEKNLGFVLRAFADFLYRHKLDELSKTLFLIVGDGVDKERLAGEAIDMGISLSVRFLGKITGPDLADIYRLGDVFVTASEIETQGIVLIEAAASGLPLIAVNGGAVAEICKNNLNGFLLEPGDKEGMVEAMTRLLTDAELRRKMSAESVKIADSHSLERTLDRFVDIYNKVIKRGSKNSDDVLQ